MPLVKKTSGMMKEFVSKGQHYSFYFLPDEADPNPASRETFNDEEIVRRQYWYPFIEKGDIIFDIGAAFGSYCLPALAMEATVYAFSPEHEFPKIRASVEENRGFRQRYHGYDFGFYSETGFFKTDTAEFFDVNNISTDKIKQSNNANWTGWYIAVQKLDDFVPTLNLDKISYLKIDTEGAELEILKGGIKTIKKYKPKILVEFHLFKNAKIQTEINEFLTKLGYENKGTVDYTPHVHHGFYLAS